MTEEKRWAPQYEAHPKRWPSHPRKKMLMTPALVFFGGIFAYLIPTVVAGFFHLMFFHPPVSQEWTPLQANAYEGRKTFMVNGCVYCHSGYTRPQDVREGLYYLYPRTSLPGDFATSDESPNNFGTARIGPDLSQEGGFHPDDWQRAHFADPRFVDPDSIMPRFDWLTDKEVNDLALYMQTRSGKSGLIRYAGQLYMKKLFLAAASIPPPPTFTQAKKKTLADVAIEASSAPAGPSGTVDGLGWPDPINLNHVDRGYWSMSNPLPVTTDNLMRGRFIFQERCIGCHGRGGAAVSEAARFMSPTPIDFTGPDDASSGADTSPGDYYYRVLRGINGTAMENFGSRLRVDDIWRVVLFLKTIPKGGLLEDEVVTPDKYIQWKPPPDFLDYVEKHPALENQDLIEKTASTDPFVLEFRRCLPGLNERDRFVVPGYGPVSIKDGARDIKAIYTQLLDKGWADYQARGGHPVPPASQKDSLPDLTEELR